MTQKHARVFLIYKIILVGLGKAQQELLLSFLANTLPLVGYADLELAVKTVNDNFVDFNVYKALLCREPNGVAQEMDDDLLNALRIQFKTIILRNVVGEHDFDILCLSQDRHHV